MMNFKPIGILSVNIAHVVKSCGLLIILVFTHLSLYAQSTPHVSGTVKTSNDEMLPFANVCLIDKTDKTKMYGATTDEEGKFSIPVPAGIYLMEISYVGYVKYSFSVQVDKDVSIPDIILDENSERMDEIVVRARTVTYNPTGYIAEISGNPFYRNYDLSDILKLTPGTHANFREIQVYGKAVSKVYVDGREVRLSGEDLIQYLKSFNGRNVKQMEVIASSGTEDDASSGGSSIIRITTVRVDGGMVSASMNYNYSRTTRFTSPNANVQWRRNKWSTYFTGSLPMGRSTRTDNTETEFYDSGIRMITDRRSEHKVRNILTTLGVGYDINKNNIISVEGAFRRMRIDPASYTTTKQWDQDLKDFLQTAAGSSINDRDVTNYIVSMNYTRLFDKGGNLLFMLDRVQSDADNISNNEYLYTDGNDMQYDNRNQEKSTIHTAGVTYEQPFNGGKSKLTAGAKYTDIANESNTDYNLYNNDVQDSGKSYEDIYEYSERVYAMYAKYSFTLGNFSTVIGTRLEHSIISPNSRINPEGNLKSRYTDLFPEVGINYSIGKNKAHNLGLNYVRSISRPSMYLLNPLIIRQNEYSYSMGNPSLKPSYGDSYSLRLLLFTKYVLSVSYYTSKNGDILKGNTEPGSDIIYTQPRNGLTSRRCNIYAEFPVSIGKWGRLKLSGNYSFGKDEYGEDKDNYESWNVGLSGTFSLPYDIDIMADIRYDPPESSLYHRSYNHSIYSNVNISKPFLKKRFVFSLLFNDIFNMLGSQSSEYFYDKYRRRSSNTYKGTAYMARINYTVKWGSNSAKVRRNTSGSSSEQGRISSDKQ